MTTEQNALLAAITANRSDNTARLAFADWLDENGEPDRAAYLRLQVELVREWWYDKPCTELYARMAELAGRIDPAWLAIVRRCTTPAPLVNVEEVFPEVRGKSKTAVRLHPRPGKAPIDASKIGGMFLWPEAEPWPTCTDHDVPYVTALQLRKEDVPELGFPSDTDLFQLLWCPSDHYHDNSYCPKPAIYWRKRSDVTRTRKRPPRWKQRWELYDIEEGSLPRLCVVYPERVVEYPCECYSRVWSFEDPAQPLAIQGAFALGCRLALPENFPPLRDIETLYRSWLSEAVGSKIGGFPTWNHQERFPKCACGRDMEYLLGLASSEYDADTWGKWVPIEDRPILYRPERSNRPDIYEPHGFLFGRGATLKVFVCREHSDRSEWPAKASID